MNIDLLKESLAYDEILFVNKFIGKIFKQFFKLKGFKNERNSAVKKDIHFYYEYNSPALTFFGYKTFSQDKPIQFMLMRYYDYPNIDNDFGFSTWTPNQKWILGFIERLLYSLNKYILKIIDEDGEEFQTILNNNEQFMQRIVKPEDWNKYIIETQKKNLTKTFVPRYFNFERCDDKEILADINKLIKETDFI